MSAYAYRGCRVHIHKLQFHEGLWKGDATVTIENPNETVEQQIFIAVGASSEEMALAMAASQCNMWVDDHIG